MLPWFTKYPNQNDEILNLDWVIKQVENLKAAYEAFLAANSLTFADPIVWDITKQYSKNTIVLSPEGDAFLSLQIVPDGIQLNNTEYWLEIFNFAEYVRTANSNLTMHIEQNTTRATDSYAIDDWLLWEDVLYKVTAAIAVDDLLTVGTNIVHFTVEDFCRAWVASCTSLINQYKNDIDASEAAYHVATNLQVTTYKNEIDASEAAYKASLDASIASTTASLQAQLDAAISGATVDSEVINARVMWDGVTASTLRDAIVTQYSDFIRFKFIQGITSGDNTQFVPFSVEADEEVTVYTADGEAFTNATIYFFNANKTEISHYALTSGLGNSRTFTPSNVQDSYSIRVINNDSDTRDYIIKNNSSVTGHLYNELLNIAVPYTGQYEATLNLDTAFTAGNYRIATASGTLPSDFSANHVIAQINVYDGWVIQIIYHMYRPDEVYARYMRISNPQYVWHKLTIPNYSKSGTNIDTIVSNGHYTVSSPTGTLPDDYPSGVAAILNVIGYGEDGTNDNNPRWYIQTIYPINNVAYSWVRIIDVYNHSASDWSTSYEHSGNPLNGKKIVFFGDSLTGNFMPPDDFPSMIALATGASIINLGVGGTGATDVDSDNRKEFSLPELVDAIVSENYSAQEGSSLEVTYAADGPSGFINTGIDYIPTRVNSLTTIDWDSVDYVVIALGTNDWAQGRHIKNNNNDMDITTYYGGLNYSISQLLNKYPHLRILLVTPSWRWDTGSPYKDSDTWQLYGNYLYEFADAMKEIGQKYHLYVYDQYYEGGFNKPNRLAYFYNNDGTHPKKSGRELMASKIGNAILNS